MAKKYFIPERETFALRKAASPKVKRALSDPRHAAFLARVGHEMRTARLSAGATQQQIADLFGWGRAAANKLETGETDISLWTYLMFVRSMREYLQDDPALEVANRLLGGRVGPKLVVDH